MRLHRGDGALRLFDRSAGMTAQWRVKCRKPDAGIANPSPDRTELRKGRHRNGFQPTWANNHVVGPLTQTVNVKVVGRIITVGSDGVRTAL